MRRPPKKRRIRTTRPPGVLGFVSRLTSTRARLLLHEQLSGVDATRERYRLRQRLAERGLPVPDDGQDPDLLVEATLQAMEQGQLDIDPTGRGYDRYGGALLDDGALEGLFEDEPASDRSSRVEPRPEVDDWVGVQLFDFDGQPVPGTRYEIDLPDGTMRSGTLDSEGYARVDHIESGQCKVRFFDVPENRVWRQSSADTDRGRPDRDRHFRDRDGLATDDWIQIVVADETGNPVGGIEYQLVLADGSTEGGTVPDDGVLRLENIEPGSCKLSFPRLGDEDWQV